MHLDRDHIIAGNKIGKGGSEAGKVDGISGVVRRLSLIVHGTSGHVKTVEFLAVDIENTTVIDDVTESDGCRRGRWRIEMITEIEGVVIHAVIQARNRGLYRIRQTAAILLGNQGWANAPGSESVGVTEVAPSGAQVNVVCKKAPSGVDRNNNVIADAGGTVRQNHVP